MVLLFVCLFGDRVSLCSPGYPRTYSVNWGGLKLRDPPAFIFASQVLGFKVCAITAGLDGTVNVEMLPLLLFCEQECLSCLLPIWTNSFAFQDFVLFLLFICSETGSHYEAVGELTKISLPLPSTCWD